MRIRTLFLFYGAFLLTILFLLHALLWSLQENQGMHPNWDVVWVMDLIIVPCIGYLFYERRDRQLPEA